MVARAAADHCTGIGDDVAALSRQQLDISDREGVLSTIASVRPDAIFNCAAYTDVDGAESHPEAARAANTAGVENLALAARESGARLITISTDYVFDGSNPGFYTEDDEPNPQGVYATTKYEGEIAAAKADPDVVIVRSGWIYGEGGTNFLSVMHLLLGDGRKIRAIEDSYGTPTYAVDLARELRDLADRNASGVYHVTNHGPGTSYLGFAEKVCKIGGFDRGQIEAVSKDELKRPAPRPASSKLRSIKLKPLPNWEEALRRFLKK